MSHFYGTLQGDRDQVTRRGHKSSGLVVQAAGWTGAIRVELSFDHETGRDRYRVVHRNWPHQGDRQVLAEGYLDEGAPEVGDEVTAKDPAVSGWV